MIVSHFPREQIGNSTVKDDFLSPAGDELAYGESRD
jgi:hypothetical protein